MPVAVTGGTGFLGLHLVRGLLASRASIVLLARGEPESVLNRIGCFLAMVGEPAELVGELPDRIRVVSADVAQPRYGLSAAAFAELADDLDAIWHSAGNTTLDADLGLLRGVNVEGTRNALALATAGRRRPLLYHVSTAFVAGRRRYGTVYDDELADEHGFETPYEQSKYEAEVLVRAWSGTHGRPAVVFRPSVLVTNLPPAPGLPSHSLLFAARALAELKESAQRSGYRFPAGGRPEVRIAGYPDAHMNVMPVEDAAAVMLGLAQLPPADRLDTYHVVHGDEMPIVTLLSLFEEIIPVRFTLVPAVTDPSPLEARLQLLSGALAYARHRRRYDDARVRALSTARPSRGRIGLDYLLAGIQPSASPAAAR